MPPTALLTQGFRVAWVPVKARARLMRRAECILMEKWLEDQDGVVFRDVGLA